MPQREVGINADSFTINGNLDVLDALLRRFQKAGFSVVEIPVHGVGCVFNGKLREDRVKKVGNLLQRYPFRYTVHGPDPLNLSDPQCPELHESALLSTIDFAERVGGHLVVYHGGYKPGEKTPARGKDTVDEWKGEIERLRRVGRYANERGVTVAVENIFRQSTERTYRVDPRALAQVVAAVGSPGIGVCFDFGHAHISATEEGFSIQESLEEALPYLVHVHIHDNFGLPNSTGRKHLEALVLGEGDLHLPPGWGTVPYGDLLGRILPQYAGAWLLEIHPKFSEYYEEAIEWTRLHAGSPSVPVSKKSARKKNPSMSHRR